ncbi:cytochrome c [Geotalea uraniireducens]|uniref:Cytochrome c n=1 Tax=Geotalea uraniireducens TaxID=351604 RepID=A0ABM8EMT3_9BACT|nr:CxxxxCH/CxxCH domain-containing protein [Geotalea uraniireducens]BDV43886.1 cytochrome c [Geotalea uraniireducens]
MVRLTRRIPLKPVLAPLLVLLALAPRCLALTCNSCHGDPPQDAVYRNISTGRFPGSHSTHATAVNCTACHKPNASVAHLNRRVDFVSSLNNSPLTARYRNVTSLPWSPAPALGGCSNVNCHFESATPTWGSDPAATGCATCHGAPPADGSHPAAVAGPGKGHGDYYGTGTGSCGRCHPDHTAEAAPFAHATSVGKRSLAVGFTGAPNGGGSYSGTVGYPAYLPSANPPRNGSCSGVYCHSDGTAVATGTVPAVASDSWGAGVSSCSSCHGYPPAYANGAPKANSHARHPNACAKCHAGTTANGSTIADRSLHLNRSYDLAPGSGISFSYSYDAGGGTCSGISCHGGSSARWGSTSCLGCHASVQGSRAAITPQFGANSHHIQGTLSDGQCYQCHWEANADGTINPLYHGGAASPGAVVDLVIYGAGSRPAAYAAGSTAVAYTADGSRSELRKINDHCLGCHSAQNNATMPFGDGKTPRQYAWDATSVAEKYGSLLTTRWENYSGGRVTRKYAQRKAYSAHGNATANQGGWDTAETWSNTRNGSEAVLCFDCHNAHGSGAVGTTTSYASATTNGGILKDTQAGAGGYGMSYRPASGGAPADKNSYNAGAGLCFDCHLTANAGTTPWGYAGTYGETQPIMGYWDSDHFGAGAFGPQLRYPYKTLPNKGGHFGVSSPLASGATGAINGLCTPCHDPHGVSPTLGTNMKYGVPLLKGTWLSSPYREDAAPAVNAYYTNNGGEGVGYHIDQNTFTAGGITETDSQFAGLCLGCHPKERLTDGVTHTWKGKNRIHEAVKGWKTADATIKHNYSCSKCHAPHNSNLPRLMICNCLNPVHKGRVAYNPSPRLGTSYSEVGSGWGTFPGSWANNIADYPPPGVSAGSNILACHESNAADQSWNVVTQWSDDVQAISAGPAAGSFTAVGSDVRATITWSTGTDLSSSSVDYGATTAYGATAGSAAKVISHSVLLTGLVNHTTYHYRVRSLGSFNTEMVSGDATFAISVAPPVPTPTAEPDAASAAPLAVTLAWSAVTDPDGGPVEYSVEVDDDAAFGSPNYSSGWMSAASWQVTLPTATTWNWRVRSRDANHPEAVSAWSTIDSFRLTTASPPAAPTLLAQPDYTSDCINNGTATLQWQAAMAPDGDALQYYVTINGVTSGWISGTSWNATTVPDGYYTWQVKARDAVHPDAESGWSAVDTFQDLGMCYQSSCPYIFVWDGSGYRYQTDIAGTFIGIPTHRALIKGIPHYQAGHVVLDRLRADKRGHYRLKIREPLPEITYADELKLLVVDYPAGYAIVSSGAENTYPYGYAEPFRIYTVKEPLLPLSARDRDGRDVLAAVTAVDSAVIGNGADDLPFFTFDFGTLRNPAAAKLVITGWSVYGPKYRGTRDDVQPYVEVPDAAGRWVKVASFGEPSGDQKTMVVDLGNRFRSADQRVRVHFGRRIGARWVIDRIELDESAPVPVTVREVPAVSAELRHGGMLSYLSASLTRRIVASDDRLPDVPSCYGYGRFTRYGDVGELVGAADDRFVVMRHGDELDLDFAAPAPPAAGMARTAILRADLYYKGLTVSRTAEPLPYHGMPAYPYPAAGAPARGPAYRAYLAGYNTRRYASPTAGSGEEVVADAPPAGKAVVRQLLEKTARTIPAPAAAPQARGLDGSPRVEPPANLFWSLLLKVWGGIVALFAWLGGLFG